VTRAEAAALAAELYVDELRRDLGTQGLPGLQRGRREERDGSCLQSGRERASPPP
jgi:hypothetical protein